MNRTFTYLLLCASILLLSFSPANAPEWQLTDGYSIRFKTKKVNGFFHTLKGKIAFDENNLSSSYFKMEIDAASIGTGNSLKTWHSKKKKWFNAKEFPSITFNSTKISKTEKGFLANGLLKIKGVEKSVSLPFTFISKVFTGQLTILRSDFGVGKTKGLSKLVGDTIRVNITVPVVKP